MSIASLVLGIISVLIALFAGAVGWLGAIFGIIGIVLAVQGRKEPEPNGMATAGLILSIIGTVLNLIMFIACAACVGTIGSMSL